MASSSVLWFSCLTVFVYFGHVCGLSHNFLDGDLELADGIELISVPIKSSPDGRNGRSYEDDSTVLGRLSKFLQGHELRVKLPNLVEKDKMTKALSEALNVIDDKGSDDAATGRKKGDGGASAMMLAGLMMAKTLAAVGFGGLGLLTMKALMVSALALMLSAIVGVKKLSSGHDEGGHQVHYVEAGGHHHRRKREADNDLPYMAWLNYPNDST